MDLPDPDPRELDPNNRTLGELLRMHELQRRIFRRFLGWLAISVTGFVSCLIRRTDSVEDAGDLVRLTGLLALSAMIMGLIDARDLRELHRQMQLLLKHLRLTGGVGAR